MIREKIVFFGSGAYTIPVVEMLKKHNLICVITTEKEGGLIDYLKRNLVPFICTNLQAKEDIEKLKNLKPTLGVLASYGVILTESIINLFPNGIINIHPSLLPRHRGPTPIQTTILDGDTTTGVTIHMLDEIVDHGAVLDQMEIALNGDETTQDLKNSLFNLGSEMIEKLIKKIESGEKLSEKKQKESLEYTKKLTRESGYIDVDNPPNPQMLDRMIRAYYPWPTVWFRTELMGTKRQIKLLPKNRIQIEGKKVTDYKNFINGYQQHGITILKKLGVYRDAVGKIS